MPLSFARNGTFLAYRKLKQRAKKWNDFIDDKAKEFAIVLSMPNHVDAKQTLMAKMAGRWTDGVPVSAASTADEWRAFNQAHPEGSPERDKALVNFRYLDDPNGERCPMGSHLRRVNTRELARSASRLLRAAQEGPKADGDITASALGRVLRSTTAAGCCGAACPLETIPPT